jgi:Lon protease-like protein
LEIDDRRLRDSIGREISQSTIRRLTITNQSTIEDQESPMILPPTIPIFPLPNVVLFPNVFLPLHIFESRYRDMVKDALASDRIIGMVLLQPGFEANYEGRPPVYPVGCAGVITHSEPLPDGRFNIVLRGIEKFRMVGEDESRPYRLAHIEAVPEVANQTECAAIKQHRQRLEALLAAVAANRRPETRLPSTVPDQDLVNALAQYAAFDPIERQALLECNGVLSRCLALIELLEMRTMALRGTSWAGGSVH